MNKYIKIHEEHTKVVDLPFQFTQFRKTHLVTLKITILTLVLYYDKDMTQREYNLFTKKDTHYHNSLMDEVRKAIASQIMSTMDVETHKIIKL